MIMEATVVLDSNEKSPSNFSGCIIFLATFSLSVCLQSSYSFISHMHVLSWICFSFFSGFWCFCFFPIRFFFSFWQPIVNLPFYQVFFCHSLFVGDAFFDALINRFIIQISRQAVFMVFGIWFMLSRRMWAVREMKERWDITSCDQQLTHNPTACVCNTSSKA